MKSLSVRWRTLIPAVLFLIIAGLFLAAVFRGDGTLVPSPLIGRAVPVFSLPAIKGMGLPGFTDADFGKGVPVVVNVWASWCVPCRDEHAVLSALKAKADVVLFGFNYKDTGEGATQFLAELGNPFTRLGADASGRVGIDWGVYGVPETYIVDGRGRIVYKHVGPLTMQIVDDEVLPALRAASVP